jgi:hypothetical protein
MKIILPIACVALLAGCQGFNNSVVTPALKTLAQIGNTAVADATQAKAVALAATPPDTDGANCWTGVITVIGEIQQVNAAAGGPNAGVFTSVEMASLFKIDSAQYNQVTNLLGSDCIAKGNDVLGPTQIAALGGIVAALPSIIQLAPAL